MAEKFDSKTFNPEAFGVYVDSVPNLRRKELIRCKALTSNEQIREALKNQTGSYYATIPLYGNLDGEPLNYDGQTDITATSTTTFEQGVIAIGRAKAWTERDFSFDITAGVDFMSNVARQVSTYWQEIDEDTLLAVLKGIFAMSGNNGNTTFVEQHTHDITGDVNGKVDAVTLNIGVQKASGDNKSAFSLVIAHSAVATNLENLNLINYVKYTDEDGIERDLNIGTWNGRLVLVDDKMPVDLSDPDNPIYTTYVLGEGSIFHENLGAKVPYEMERDPKTNGGQDTLYTRQRKVFAPYGITFTKTNVASLSPTTAELEDGSNWSLVHNGASGGGRKYFDHKAIAIARIISKG